MKCFQLDQIVWNLPLDSKNIVTLWIGDHIVVKNNWGF